MDLDGLLLIPQEVMPAFWASGRDRQNTSDEGCTRLQPVLFLPFLDFGNRGNFFRLLQLPTR
jgi:hypothetical protein